MRAQVRDSLTARAKEFNILVDDIAITHLSFGTEARSAPARAPAAWLLELELCMRHSPWRYPVAVAADLLLRRQHITQCLCLASPLFSRAPCHELLLNVV